MQHAAHGSHGKAEMKMEQAKGETKMEHGQENMHPYRLLVWMTLLMFVAMYALMYAMVDRFAHVYNSLNQVYMAALMTGAMVLLELGIMRHMYKNRGRNVVVVVLSVVVLLVSWFGIREQWGVGDRQFLRSMIPHHSGALLMCGKSSVTDPRILALCEEILSSQQREIDLMEQLLAKPAAAAP
jgi:cation transport ATPase